MKKQIFFMCLVLVGCNKGNTPAPALTGSIKLNTDGRQISYSGAVYNLITNTGIRLIAGSTSPGTSVYAINGGNGALDYFQLQFQVTDSLQPGNVNMLENSSAHTLIAYKRGDSLYGAPLTGASDFTMYVNSYTDKVLNATFSGVLKTQYGTAINITNGQITDLHASY